MHRHQWRELWPGFGEVLRVFRDADWNYVTITGWSVSRQGSTGGDAPALLIRNDPEAVLNAACRVADDY